jgi:hypothetical protein
MGVGCAPQELDMDKVACLLEGSKGLEDMVTAAGSGSGDMTFSSIINTHLAPFSALMTESTRLIVDDHAENAIKAFLGHANHRPPFAHDCHHHIRYRGLVYVRLVR